MVVVVVMACSLHKDILSAFSELRSRPKHHIAVGSVGVVLVVVVVAVIDCSGASGVYTKTYSDPAQNITRQWV